jgi:hypothetical protein
MSKLCTTLMLCLVAFVTATAQGTTDRERDGLRGPVHTLTIQRQTVLNENNTQTGGPLVLSYIMSYDSAGNRTELANYDDNGVLSRKIKFTYDPNSKKRTALTIFDANNVLLRKVMDTYSNDGFKLSRTIYDYNEDGTLYRKTVMTFDAFGQLNEVADYSADGKLARRDKAPFKEPVQQLTGRSKAIENEGFVLRFGMTLGEYSEPDEHGNWTRGIAPSTFKEYASGREVKMTEIIQRTFTYY